MKPVQEDTLNLHDIKEFAVIQDYSAYYFYSLLALILLLVLAASFLLYRYLKREKLQSRQTQLLNTLKAIDYTNAKEAAYTLTLCGHELIKDAPQTKAYENLLPKLEAFKYKKRVDDFSDDLRQEAQEFIAMMES